MLHNLVLLLFPNAWSYYHRKDVTISNCTALGICYKKVDRSRLICYLFKCLLLQEMFSLETTCFKQLARLVAPTEVSTWWLVLSSCMKCRVPISTSMGPVTVPSYFWYASLHGKYASPQYFWYASLHNTAGLQQSWLKESTTEIFNCLNISNSKSVFPIESNTNQFESNIWSSEYEHTSTLLTIVSLQHAKVQLRASYYWHASRLRWYSETRPEICIIAQNAVVMVGNKWTPFCA